MRRGGSKRPRNVNGPAGARRSRRRPRRRHGQQEEDRVGRRAAAWAPTTSSGERPHPRSPPPSRSGRVCSRIRTEARLEGHAGARAGGWRNSPRHSEGDGGRRARRSARRHEARRRGAGPSGSATRRKRSERAGATAAGRRAEMARSAWSRRYHTANEATARGPRRAHPPGRRPRARPRARWRAPTPWPARSVILPVAEHRYAPRSTRAAQRARLAPDTSSARRGVRTPTGVRQHAPAPDDEARATASRATPAPRSLAVPGVRLLKSGCAGERAEEDLARKRQPQLLPEHHRNPHPSQRLPHFQEVQQPPKLEDPAASRGPNTQQTPPRRSPAARARSAWFAPREITERLGRGRGAGGSSREPWLLRTVEATSVDLVAPCEWPIG